MSKKKKTRSNKKSKPKKIIVNRTPKTAPKRNFDKPAAKTFRNEYDPALLALLAKVKSRTVHPYHNTLAEHYYATEKAKFPERVYMTQIFVTKDFVVKVEDGFWWGGRELDLLTTRKKNIRYFSGFKTVQKFTDEVILIHDYYRLKNFWDKILYKKDDKIYLFDTEEGNVTEISGGEKFPADLLFDENGELKPSVIEYNNPAVWCPGLTYDGYYLQRAYLAPACNLKNFNPKHWLENIFYRDIDETEYQTKTFYLPSFDSCKNFDAFTDIGTFAIYMGELLPDGKGSALISDDFAVKAFNEHFNDKENKISEMIGTVVLCRPYFCDSVAKVVSREYINALIEQRGCEKIIFRRDNMTEENARDLQKAISQGGGKYKDKLVVVADKNFDGNIDYLTGLSAFDNPADLRRKSGLNVLGMSRNFASAEDNVTFDKSFTALLFNIDLKAGKTLFEKVWMDYADKRMAELNPDNPPSSPSFEDVKNNPRKAGLKMLGVRRYAQIFPSQYQEMLKELQEELDKMLSGSSFPTLGAKCIAIADLACGFGVNILNGDKDCVEVLCKFAESEKVTTFIGTLPRGEEPADFFKLKNVTVEDYIERLKKSDLPENLKAILSEHIYKMSYGVIIFPASARCSNGAKNLFGSNVKLYFRKDIVEFIWAADSSQIKSTIELVWD
ncbi:MAG: hypothetical protein II902_11375 [Selenomonadaceae bacterium]|nr:hypothetical protein [Selenomonadaceae bacterium]